MGEWADAGNQAGDPTEDHAGGPAGYPTRDLLGDDAECNAGDHARDHSGGAHGRPCHTGPRRRARCTSCGGMRCITLGHRRQTIQDNLHTIYCPSLSLSLPLSSNALQCLFPPIRADVSL
eukprot:5651457-Pyramimonas_sp.AAC.1